jgi:hypothetical protein
VYVACWIRTEKKSGEGCAAGDDIMATELIVFCGFVLLWVMCDVLSLLFLFCQKLGAPERTVGYDEGRTRDGRYSRNDIWGPSAKRGMLL